MKIWLITCVLLFVVIELFAWVKQFILPLPLYLLAGAFLAIASNYEKVKSLLPPAENSDLGEREEN
ncbi:hypothetical protein [Gloeocapsa sp. PCC 73106]|uniref:hypothetical protein n=1 Tax=Gloeocapsa sp. PCC 73106 TaxID=102232 RepID=UPI0002AC2875|nr:hypothetical protein [Gloeocapsa sp. PCC 73106]ELR99590.1 hypothetical protein GLO73106DRAFT_00034420 [Gloeocapsa sp. PCC 73106]